MKGPRGRAPGARDERGMTLVETLLVVALLGIAAVVLTQMVNVSVRTQTNVRMNADFQAMVALLSQVLQNGAACTDNLAGKTFNGAPATLPAQIVPIPEVRGRTVAGVPGPVLAQVGRAISPNLTLTTLQLRSFQPVNAGVNYWVEVFAEATKAELFSLGGRTLQASFFVPIQTSGPLGALAIGACGLRQAPAPVSLVGCYHTIIGNVWHDPCGSLVVDGFTFEDTGIHNDLSLPCLPIGRTIGMVVCKAK